MVLKLIRIKDRELILRQAVSEGQRKEAKMVGNIRITMRNRRADLLNSNGSKIKAKSDGK